ncbi:MAG: hypothetical protein U5K37_06040 [Natrialbaceae archaeon]|nr:hypothetical protein [Natrialbaceae archaeon]
MSESAPSWLSPEPGEELHWQGQPRIQTLLYGIGVGLVVAVGAWLADLGLFIALLGLVVPIVLVYLMDPGDRIRDLE